MNHSRRQALLTTLFGTGYVGLRALATGLPVAFLLNPRKALASNMCGDGGMPSPGKAQFVIMSTSGAGDPINANCPGSYVSGTVHPLQPGFAATGANAAPSLTMNGTAYQAAAPWGQLQSVGGVNMLNRTLFFHMATNTPIHPAEPQVLALNGVAANEMLPSLLAKAVSPTLCTVQPQPVSVGAATPAEALSYSGSTLPIIPPGALQDTLLNPSKGRTMTPTALTSLQPIRDSTMNSIYSIYKNVATKPQQQYIDELVTSQQQVRMLNQQILQTLATLDPDPVKAQIQAAVTLIQLQVSPVISIHIPFGGDNHGDPNLTNEVTQTTSGVGYIAYLLGLLQSNNAANGMSLQDQVMFMSLNVFGRTLLGNGAGRGHNGNHHVGVCIGKPFNGGVIGGCAPVKNALGNDYGATPIVTTGGTVAAADTLSAFGMTMLAAVGGDPTVIQSTTGQVVTAALA